MTTGWRLGVVLILFAAAAVILHVIPPVKGTVNPVALFALPMTLGPWSGADGVPEEILPSDPNEKFSVRRTYRHGDQVSWVSVALFVGQDDEARRASVNRIYPRHSVSLIEPVPFAVSLTGSATRSVTVPAVIVHQDSGRLLVAYWHQIGPRVYGNEYRFRLALMRDAIFTRRADALLIRIATPASAPPRVADNLGLVASLVPALYASLGQDEVRN